MDIYLPTILESLDQWSSKEEQERLWLSDGASGFTSSPVEAYAALFDDSNLANAIERGEIELPGAILDGLVRFDEAVDSIDTFRTPHRQLIDHPGMEVVRQIASELRAAFLRLETDRKHG
jgi:hypothetical protein